MSHFSPSPNSDLNAVLAELVSSVQAILGPQLLAAYLQGSFGVGDWDEHSDVDFMLVTAAEVPESALPDLQAMHTRLFALPSPWAQHLEGSYFPQALLRSADPERRKLLYLDNAHSQLERSDHDNTLVVRWVTREHGIPLYGPPARQFIDPIPAAALKQEVRETMFEWGAEIGDGRYKISNNWAWPFVVLSYCRMAHTLACGRIESKPAGARWAKTALDPRWHSLIQRAWELRPDPSSKFRQPAAPADVAETLAFIQSVLKSVG